MVRFRSTQFATLVLSDFGVRFIDGVLDTDSPEVIAYCRQLGALGVIEDNPAPPAAGGGKRTPGRPRKTIPVGG